MHLQNYLQQHTPLIIDGALATEMEARGADLHDSLWSAKYLYAQPELIAAVHRDYLDAGADILITASYQATIPGFVARGWSHAHAQTMITRAATMALEVRDSWWTAHRASGRMRPLVAGSVGPYGAYTADGGEYRGNYGLTQAQLVDFHRPRIQLLVAAGVDILACETIPDVTEALALCAVLREFPQMTAWMSFSCRGQATCAGQDMQEVAQALANFPQIVAIGANCTAPTDILGIIHAIRRATALPIVVYPNSGELYDATHGEWHGAACATDFTALAAAWYAAGAGLIGGCCRTSPQTIHALRAHFFPSTTSPRS